jgi:hypothetical protein
MDVFAAPTDDEITQLVVNDMSKDDRFSQMNQVACESLMRSFIAVPLHSPAGLVIGTFAVIGDKPREVVTEAEIQFMKDMSLSVMAYLEAGRITQQHRRAEKMIRGLGLFVEGKSSLREWWLNTGHKNERRMIDNKVLHGESLSDQADQRFGVQDSPDCFDNNAIDGVPSSGQIYRPAPNKSSPKAAENFKYAPRDDNPHSGDLSAVASDTSGSLFTKEQNVSNLSATATASTPDNGHSSVSISRHITDSQENDSGASLQEGPLSTDLQKTFSRASNLIRESIAVDGVLFLDASVGTFGGSSTKASMAAKAPGAMDEQILQFTTSSSEETKHWFAFDLVPFTFRGILIR